MILEIFITVKSHQRLVNGLVVNKKKEEAEGIFLALTDADNDMVEFTYNKVIASLDNFLGRVEQNVDSGAIDIAEEERLKFKAESMDFTEAFEKFSGELSDLVITFAQKARIGVTLD